MAEQDGTEKPEKLEGKFLALLSRMNQGHRLTMSAAQIKSVDMVRDIA